MAARRLSLSLLLCAGLAAAQEGPPPETALEAVAYKALEAQEKPPFIEEAAADWRRLNEIPRMRAALAREPLQEKARLVERLLNGILPAGRYATLRADPAFRRLVAESGAQWDESFEWAPGRRGAFVRAGRTVPLAELRDIAAEHERRLAEQQAGWRPPAGDPDELSARQAEELMRMGRQRVEALSESDPRAASAMLDSLYDFARRQRDRGDLGNNTENQMAVSRMTDMAEGMRRRAAAAPVRAPEPRARREPPREEPSALRDAFCAAFARLDVPPALTAAAAACSFAQAERRLVADKARASADLLERLARETTDPQHVTRLEGLARELRALAAGSDLSYLRTLQRDADAIVEGPRPGMERTLETLEQERVLLASATIREAVAADLLGRLGEAAAGAGASEDLLRRLAQAPETLTGEEWEALSAAFERAGAGETQRLLREALAESSAARAAVERLYRDRPELARYRAAHAALASGRLTAIADGRLADPAARFNAGELGLHALPSFIEVSPGQVDGKRGVWAHRHGRRVFTALDGSFELTVVLGEYGQPTGQARRRAGSRIIELSDPQGQAQGVEFELGGLAEASRPRDAARAAAEELAAALRRPELGGRTAAAPEPEALASFLERSLSEAQGPPPASPSLSVSPEGELEMRIWHEDGSMRVHRARFETATDFQGRPRGVALVARTPYLLRPGEENPPPSAKKAVEYLPDGSIVFWRESRGSGESAGVFSDGRSQVRVRLHRAVRGQAFGEWVEQEAESTLRETVVETLPDTSLWRHFKSELYRSMTVGDAGKLGRGPVTVGNAVRGVESLLSGLGWAGDKFYHGVVGVGQTDVAMFTGSPLGQLEAEATMARLRGFTPAQAESLVRRLPPEQRALLDGRVYEDRQRAMRAAGETMTRLGEAEYQKKAFAPPTDEERARALLERFGAGTYGARAVEEAGRRDGAARYALYAGGAAMQFGEDTARSLPQMLALSALGRLSVLRTTGGTVLTRAAGTGATVVQVGLGRVMQVSGAFGTVDGVAAIVDGASSGDWGKVMLNLGSTASDLVDFFGSARELARSGERARRLEARQRALAVFSGEVARVRAEAAPARAGDGPRVGAPGDRSLPRRAADFLFGDPAGRRVFMREMAALLDPFRPRGDNLDFQARALRRYMQDPDAVAGTIDSGLFTVQRYSDCQVRALYNHPALSAVRDRMPYERFLRLAENAADAPLRQEGTNSRERDAVLAALGYRAVEQGAPRSEAELVARLRSDGAVLGVIDWQQPLEGRAHHAVVLAGAIRGTDGSWRYLVADSNSRRYREYSFAQLMELGLRTQSVSEDTRSGRPLDAPDRERVLQAAVENYGGDAPPPGAPVAARRRWPWQREPQRLRDTGPDAPADGSHLVPPGQNRNNTDFTRPMAEADDAIKARVIGQLRERRDFTEQDIRALMDVAGEARRRVAFAESARNPDADDPHDFGARIPEAEAELADYRRDALSLLKDWEAGSTVDTAVLNGPKKVERHNQYYAPLDAILRRHRAGEGDTVSLGKVPIGGRDVPLSYIMRAEAEFEGKQYKVVKVVHPHFDDMAVLRRHARETLARAMSDRSISEAAFMDRLAEAYRLLCHATPWVRGSPAALETTFDAMLRAKFGKGLGAKRAEPFWGVMLWPENRPYTGRDFLANYEPAADR